MRARVAGAIVVAAVCGLGSGWTHAEQGDAANADSLGVWLWDTFYTGASISAGFGTRQADLTVTDQATGASGKISERDTTAYFLSYSTRPSFIGTSNVGYNFVFNYTSFDMDQQEVARNDYRDLGTRIHGRVAYVVPTLFYQVGRHGPKGAYARAGVGLGVGAAKYQGDIFLAGDTSPRRVSSGDYDLRIAGSVYLESRYRNWGITVTAAGPSYEEGGYKYNVTDISAYLSYTYYLP